MDKLRPVLKQIFWIATGFVVLMSVGGWWLAMGSLSESIESDQSKLKTHIRKSKAGGTAANAQWTAAASKLNEAYRDEFSQAERELHRSQISTRQYPSGPGGDVIAAMRFLSIIENRALRGQYRNLYQDHFLEQLKILDPFIVDDNKGLVVVDPGQIAQAPIDPRMPREPTSQEIWKAQEDLWLLRSLFESVANVNRGSERLGTSPVRELISLKLRGGKRTDGASGLATGGGGDADGGASVNVSGFGGFGSDPDGDAPAESSGGSGNRRNRRGGSNPGMQFAGSFETDLLTDEFGAEAGAPQGGGRAASASAAPTTNFFGAPPPTAAPAPVAVVPDAATGGTDGEVDLSELKGRYVDDSAEFRTRAFMLHVRVTQNDIPALLAELTNSSFPVEIVRVSSKFSAGAGSTNSGSARQQPSGGRGPRRGTGGGFGSGGGASGFGRNIRRNLGGGARRAPQGSTGGGFGSGGGSRRGRGAPRGAGDLLSQLANQDFDPVLAEKGREQKARALADTSLAELRIAGLLTLYRTKEENLLEEQAEQQEQTESGEANGLTEVDSEEPMEAVGSELAGEETGELPPGSDSDVQQETPVGGP